jgi:hypothetical protein
MSGTVSEAIKNWVPYKLAEKEGTLCCRWLYLGNTAFTAPFFDETISACRSLPENSAMISSLSNPAILPEWAAQVDAVSPTAIIFHISRCGSTLVSQLLAQQPGNIVLSEVPFFDELLRRGKTDSSFDATALLKAAVELYGKKRSGTEQSLFIKTDSWHIHFYQQLRQLYPAVPFILLYRRPDEVMRSQQKNRGMQAVQGVLDPEIFGFDKNEILQLSLDAYMGKVIESYLQAFAAILSHDKLAMPVNYNQGAMAIVHKIAAATGLEISREEMEAMQQRAGFHAKYPGQAFSEPEVPQAMPAYLGKAFELYEVLEKIRTAN